MQTTDINQTNIEKAEAIANYTQTAVNFVSYKFGGETGRAFSNFLTGNGAFITSTGDLIDKINNGTATGDDGLLVLDRNGNGVIDNGSELFGDGTMVNGIKATDGFSALRFRHPELVSGSKIMAVNNLDFNKVKGGVKKSLNYKENTWGSL